MLERLIEMEPEVLFLRCAFPCTEGKVHRKEITQEDFDYLERAARDGQVVDREMLKRVYSFAVSEMIDVAKELGKPLWDTSVIEEYFYVRHNQVIDARKGPYEGAPDFQCEYCKFYDANVVSVGERVVLARYGEKTKLVLKDFVPDVKKGDRIKFHQGYAVIKIDDKK